MISYLPIGECHGRSYDVALKTNSLTVHWTNATNYIEHLNKAKLTSNDL